MRKFLFVVFSGILFSVCCSEPPLTGRQLMPEMKDTDSVELIFFKSPDSMRYFTYAPTTDMELIANLARDVSGVVKPDSDCVKEGKIYCFRQGNIFNTIYFGYESPGCAFLRYIKNGNLYRFPMSEALKNQLMHYKALAREPVSGGAVPAKP